LAVFLKLFFDVEYSFVDSVRILGDGVAAACCARLLSSAGLPSVVEAANRPRVPAIMLGEVAQKLLHDIFDRPDLFDGVRRIRKRIVRWGRNPDVHVLPHSAVVISEAELLARLWSPASNATGNPATWTIFTTRPLPGELVEQHFGSRLASASQVKLRESADRDACWVEALRFGWLFLLPGDSDSGWLLAVGGSPEVLLASSRLVAPQIVETGPYVGEFPAHPRVASCLGADGWLACGTAALGFDPLCGDGAGNAAREAILASAVVRAALRGGDAGALVEHYRGRLLAGFKRHLEVCAEFYRDGSGEWWEQEMAAIQRGIAWCARAESPAPFRYRLNGFTLERM